MPAIDKRDFQPRSRRFKPTVLGILDRILASVTNGKVIASEYERHREASSMGSLCAMPRWQSAEEDEFFEIFAAMVEYEMREHSPLKGSQNAFDIRDESGSGR